MEHREKVVSDVRGALERAAAISKQLRKERELAFYGDIDFIPTEEYTAEDADRAYRDAEWILNLAQRVIGGLSSL